MRRMVTTCDAPGCGREFDHEPLEVRFWVGKGRIEMKQAEHHACSSACVSRLLASFGADDAATLIEGRATQHDGQAAQALWDLAKDARRGKHIGSATPPYPSADRLALLRAQIEQASGIRNEDLSAEERQMAARVAEVAGAWIDVDTSPRDAAEMLAPAIIGAARFLKKRAVERLDREAMRVVWDPVKSSDQAQPPHPFDLPGQYERMRCDGSK